MEKECKKKQVINSCTRPNPNASSPHKEPNLAAIAVSLDIRLRSSDMPFAMQERAIRLTRSLLDSSTSRPHNLTLLARSIKKEFDKWYGPAWHCIAGKSFGSFVTHSPGGFVYFSADKYSFLLFKTAVQLISDEPPSLSKS
uniref:dynein light chain, cytoplasmic-like n=1 Tax=Erigeron canadensis TaxID=72917 RepID=UPI001CB973CC|nr:dynein light chain, cytoplasmic-like [Erigeron canadensis]